VPARNAISPIRSIAKTPSSYIKPSVVGDEKLLGCESRFFRREFLDEDTFFVDRGMHHTTAVIVGTITTSLTNIVGDAIVPQPKVGIEFH
jgi:hypothetical protein